MKPTQFKESNATLTAPQQEYSTDVDAVQPLNIWSNGEQCVSCWKMSWGERLSVLFRGKVWLLVLSGQTQPPVALSITKKFFYEVERIPGNPIPQPSRDI